MKFKEIARQEHGGFATTLEFLLSLVLITMFVTMNLYIVRVMNTQRFMNTVLTSTAAQASRWGGVDTEAYKLNVSSVGLIKNAQNQLNKIAPGYGGSADGNCPKIWGTPNKIAKNGDTITLTIRYKLPSVFNTMSRVGTYDMSSGIGGYLYMTVEVRSIMGAGKLL